MEKGLNYKYDKKARTDSIRNAESNKVKDAQYFAQKIKLKQQKIFRYLLFAGIILVLIFGSVLFNTFKNAKKQKELIESQNDVIINRINQSKKIQRSMLPSFNDMKKSFSDLYVFYDPKDIVSGDFYWHTSFDHFELIACVDCTGHGDILGFQQSGIKNFKFADPIHHKDLFLLAEENIKNIDINNIKKFETLIKLYDRAEIINEIAN